MTTTSSLNGSACHPFSSLEGDDHKTMLNVYGLAAKALSSLGGEVRLLNMRRCYINGGKAYMPFTGLVQANVTDASDSARRYLGPSAAITLRVDEGGGILSVDIPARQTSNASVMRPGPRFDTARFITLLVWLVIIGALWYMLYAHPPALSSTSSSSSSSSSSYHHYVPRRAAR